jgi:hypothetical protein
MRLVMLALGLAACSSADKRPATPVPSDPLTWHQTDWRPHRALEWQAKDDPLCDRAIEPGTSCAAPRAVCNRGGSLLICGDRADLCAVFCLSDCKAWPGPKWPSCP